MLRHLWILQLFVLCWGSPTRFVHSPLDQLVGRGGRIAGGTRAARNQFPYQVAFFIYTGNQQSLCGGSIFSSNFLLSAAHCFVSFDSADVFGGITDIAEDDTVYDHEVFPTDIINHPQYNRVSQLNDIALVRTSRKPITFSAAIQPLPLIPRSMTNADLTNAVARIAGWGRTTDSSSDISQVLLFMDALIISNAECTRTYGSAITTSNICLSGANGRSTCPGDSGGPLTITNSGKQVQVGIVSFGSASGCTRGHPTAFTRITSFYTWIQTTTGVSIL